MGIESAVMVIVTPIPVVGYEFLENRGFRVNPVMRRIERASDEESHPPFQLMADS